MRREIDEWDGVDHRQVFGPRQIHLPWNGIFSGIQLPWLSFVLPSLPWLFPTLPFSILPLPQITWPRLPEIHWPPSININPPHPNLPGWIRNPHLPANPDPMPEPMPEPIQKPPQPRTTNLFPDPVSLNPDVKPENYSPKDGCVLYAQNRRPDLGRAGGGAANYISNFKDTIFQVPSTETDLHYSVAKGYALVWPREHPDTKGSAGWIYGHVAIIEEVGKDYVVVSQAGWGSETQKRFSLEQVASLYVIP